MDKFYILLSDYMSSKRGSIFRYDSNELTDCETDETLLYEFENLKDSLHEITSYNDFQTMSKEDRANACEIQSKKVCDDKIMDECQSVPKLKHVNSNIFLRRDSVINNLDIKEPDDETKSKLFKVHLNKGIYGSVTKKIGKYNAIALLPMSKEIVKHYPNSQFNNNFFDANQVGIVVDEEFVKEVKGNLVFHKNRSIVNEDMILKNEIFMCPKFPKDEYVKFNDGTNQMVAQVLSCHKINGRQCIKVKLVESDSTRSPGEPNEVYICFEDSITTGLKNMTKYYNGVMIDPTSIVKMENHEFVSCNIHLNDTVNVTLRDSVNICGFVVWLGKVNDIEVAAVKSATTLSNLNLLCNGKFREKVFFDNDSYIFPLSTVGKVDATNTMIANRINEITKSLKDSYVTEGVQQMLPIIYDHINSFRAPSDISKEFLALSKAILKRLRLDLISKKLYNDTSIVVSELEKKDQVLWTCSLKLLDILCDLCSMISSFVGEISLNPSLMDILESIFRDIHCYIDSVEEIKKLSIYIMTIFWSIIKTDNKKSSDWFTKMNDLFFRKNIDENIKLMAALCLSFLMNNLPVNVEVVSFLRKTYKDFPSNTQGVNKNDILLALGKIFESQDFQITSNQTSEIISSSNHPNEISESSEEHHAVTAYEESLSDKYKLSVEDYENCIRIFATNDMSQENINQLTIYIAKLNDKSTFPIFIRNQNPMIFGKIPGLIDEISPYEESYKSFLEKCIIPEDEYVNAVNTVVQSVNAQKTSNVELILNKLDPTEDLDPYLLELAVAALKNDMFDILTMALHKCTNVNSHFTNGETFITRIIREKFVEDDIIKSIQSDDRFDINQKSKENMAPIQMAKKYSLKKVFDFICTLDFDKEVLFYD